MFEFRELTKEEIENFKKKVNTEPKRRYFEDEMVLWPDDEDGEEVLENIFDRKEGKSK